VGGKDGLVGKVTGLLGGFYDWCENVHKERDGWGGEASVYLKPSKKLGFQLLKKDFLPRTLSGGPLCWSRCVGLLLLSWPGLD
jgi:hypothetical protein